MGTTLNRPAFQKLVDEDLAWLLEQPRTLERDHVEQIVKKTPELYYDLIDWAQEKGRGHHKLSLDETPLQRQHSAFASAYFSLAKELRERLHGPGGS